MDLSFWWPTDKCWGHKKKPLGGNRNFWHWNLLVDFCLVYLLIPFGYIFVFFVWLPVTDQKMCVSVTSHWWWVDPNSGEWWKKSFFLGRQAICESLRKKNMNHRELTKATWKFYYAKDASPRKNPRIRLKLVMDNEWIYPGFLQSPKNVRFYCGGDCPWGSISCIFCLCILIYRYIYIYIYNIHTYIYMYIHTFNMMATWQKASLIFLFIRSESNAR